MHAVTDFLHLLTGIGLTAENYERIGTLANHAINSGNSRWYREVAKIVADHTGMNVEQARTAFEHSIPYSDAIRYVQIGNPEKILLTDRALYDLDRQSESTKSETVEHLITEITNSLSRN